MVGAVHIVGAGLAGLAAAVDLSARGRTVHLYEAAGHAGGRCRSYYEPALDRVIDNGNHLLLRGNRAALGYLSTIGAGDSLIDLGRAEFRFLDLKDDIRWTVRPDRGRIPWSLLAKSNRVPGSGLGGYLRGARLAWAGPEETVLDCLGPKDALFERFWEPFAVAVLNTSVEEAAAHLLWPVLRETFGRGEVACRPLLTRAGLGPSFVDPALSYLERNGASISFNKRLRSLGYDGENGRVGSLHFADSAAEVTSADHVILAIPPAGAHGLLPDLTAPDDYRAIVNGHFLLPGPMGDLSFMGIVGGTCQWLFVRGDTVSVTVSAADALVDEPAETIVQRMWPEVARALELGDAPLGAYRIVKEKRATFAQTPAQVRRRPGQRTTSGNLFVAGDWTDTGLPATIEGAIRSGQTAAQLVKSE